MSGLNEEREQRRKKLWRFMMLNLGLALLGGSFFLDELVAEFISLVYAPGLTDAMNAITQLGALSSVVLFVLCLYVFGFFSSHDAHRQTAILAMLTLFTAGFCVMVVKLLAARGSNGEFHWLWGWNRHTIMFPSGHAAMVCAVSVVLGRAYRSLRWPLFVVVLAVAISRVYLVHFFSDVVAGLFVGCLVSYLVLRYAGKSGFIRSRYCTKLRERLGSLPD